MGPTHTRGDSPDAAADELAEALAAMTPPGVIFGVRRISISDVDRLTPGENDLTAVMADVRRAEFASGRALLHDLLATNEPILRAPNGAPSLPRGVVGSLAHDRHRAIAVVTARAGVSAIGVDFEPITADPLTNDDAAIIVRDDDVVPGPLAAFVMKEAAYKAWSGLGGPMLDHHDVRIDHDGDAFRATVLIDSDAAMRTELVGRVAQTPRHYLALVIVSEA